MFSELRAALRSLRRTPAFTLTVVGILALGIGGSTAVFSIVNQVLLRPLSYDQPGQLVRIYQDLFELNGERRSYVTGFAFLAFEERLTALESVAATYTYSARGADLGLPGGAERLSVLPVTAGYFDVLRAQPVLGRGFTRAEQDTTSRVVVLSHELWQSRFGGDRTILGRVIHLSDEPYTVIGVAPPALEDPVMGAIDVWQPLDPTVEISPQHHLLTVLGRLRAGIAPEQARAELALLDRALVAGEPNAAGRPSELVGLHEDTVGRASRTLYLLLGAVGLLLLIGCVNVANLLLARSTVRERELAVRAALGAGRGRLLRQLLLESLALGLAGGAAGVLLGLFIIEGIIGIGSSSLPRLTDAAFDLRVLGFALAVSLGSTLLFGLLPALRSARIATSSVLRDQSRSVTADRRRQAARSLLVGAQIALAFLLLAGASVLTLSLYRLSHVGLGITDEAVLTYEVHLPASRYDAAARAHFHEELAARTAALPGVAAAGAVSRLPATGTYHNWGIAALTGPRAGDDERLPPAEQRVVAGEYFAALDIPLIAGRLFEEGDVAGTPRVVIINRALAAAAFPDGNAVGGRLNVIGDTVSVIGVVEDVALTVEGDVAATIYHAHRQFADDRNWALTQVVRSAGSSLPPVAATRHVLAELDPALVLHQPAPLGDVLGRGIAQRRFTTWLMTGFAGLALLLAITGLFGVVTYVVRQRWRELGIRTALGAGPGEIRGLVVSQGLRITAAGVLAGLAGALALGRVMESLVFETEPADPLVLAGAALLLAGVAALAAWLPARQATRVDPRIVLTQE